MVTPKNQINNRAARLARRGNPDPRLTPPADLRRVLVSTHSLHHTQCPISTTSVSSFSALFYPVHHLQSLPIPRLLLRFSKWTILYHIFDTRPDTEFKLSEKGTSPFYLIENEDLFTQESHPGRTFGESVGGIFEMDSSDWSNGIRYHIFDTRPDTEFKTWWLHWGAVCISLATSQGDSILDTQGFRTWSVTWRAVVSHPTELGGGRQRLALGPDRYFPPRHIHAL